jgi:leucyl aminopeptidase
MATLTGAARVALGPEVPPFFTDSDEFAVGLTHASAAVFDPVWRLPLWRPYDSWLSSRTADLNHVSTNTFAGSIVAALFLRRFISAAEAFAHFDIFAWNPTARPIGPEGGEAQAIRALYQYLSGRYG